MRLIVDSPDIVSRKVRRMQRGLGRMPTCA